MRSLLFAVLLALASASMATPAAAHVGVRSTSIAENAVLAEAPADFTVSFSGATGLASVVLTDADGVRIPMRYVPPRRPASTFTIPLPRLAAGQYTLTWRTMSHDGHVMSGAVHFRIGA